MISVIILGIAHATICKVGQPERPCTPVPTINYRTYGENDQDCSGTSTISIWNDHMWDVCESSQVETIGRILRCTGNENTMEVEEYDSKYCLLSPSRTYTITKDACSSYREPDGDLVYRKFTWTYNPGDIVCPSGDALIGVVKYGNEGCESGRSGEWVEMIPRFDTCFNSSTPNNFADIRRSVTCDGRSGTIVEYSDTSDPYENCTSSATSLEISNGECVEWTDPTDPSYSEYRRMYFNCDRGSATALTIFWMLIFSMIQY